MTWEQYTDDDGICGVRFDDSHSVGWDLEGWCDKCTEYMDLVAAAPELLEALEAIEWVGIQITNWGSSPYNSPVDESPDDWCPWCGAARIQGHYEECVRQAAIAKAKGEV